jgi:hypothetical protein
MQNLSLSIANTEDDLAALIGFIEERELDVLPLSKSIAYDLFVGTSEFLGREELLSTNQDRMWQFYAANLRSFITGGNPAENLQLTTSLNPIRWNDPDFGSYYFNVDTADKMPERGGQYAKSSQSFSESYYAFMSSINPQPVNEDALVKANEIELERRQDSIRLLDVEFEYATAWQSFDDRQRILPPQRRLTSEQWYERVGADASIKAVQDIIDAKEGVYLYWMQQALSADEPLLEALKKYRDFKRIAAIKVPRSSLNPTDQSAGQKNVIPYVLSPDFPNWMQEAPSRAPNIKITYSTSSETYDYSKTSIAGGAIIGFGFFCAFGAGRRTTTEINLSSESFTFEFKAVAEVFTINPDQWYDSTIFELYQDGPFKEGGPIAKAYSEDRLFGPKGFINFRPARAIVAYKPSLTVKFSREEYNYFKQETNGWAAVGIGPFLIGAVGSYSDVRVSVRSNDESGTLELFAEDNLPYLLGFDYENMDPRV